jgi:FAD/FMN-containing dehydrogenase
MKTTTKGEPSLAPSVPAGSLRKALGPQDATVLTPADPAYSIYQRCAAANRRAAVSPEVRVVLRTREGAAAAVTWLRDNAVPFAIRGGGHCYESFSQNHAVVLDLRGMADIRLEKGGAQISVGGGALLGEIYAALVKVGRIVPAGSCPQVGAAGHVLGGGYGMFARKWGLTCDSLIGAEIVDAGGRILQVSDTQESELFWALRGGGAGSFGVVTRLAYKTTEIANGARFSIDWGADSILGINQAVEALLAWQAWAPNAPRELSAIMRISGSGGRPRLHCSGISTIPNESWVRRQLESFAHQTRGSIGTIEAQSAEELLKHFAGAPNKLTGALDDTEFFKPLYYKGKSDVITVPLGADSFEALVSAAAEANGVAVICDPYGGAIADVPNDATAFVHRSGTIFNIQYYTEWKRPNETRRRLGEIASVYSALSSSRTGGAYFNYCDLDLGKNAYASDYWGANLPRLQAAKSVYDPENLFRHAQSVQSSRTEIA